MYVYHEGACFSGVAHVLHKRDQGIRAHGELRKRVLRHWKRKVDAYLPFAEVHERKEIAANELSAGELKVGMNHGRCRVIQNAREYRDRRLVECVAASNACSMSPSRTS